MQRDKAKLASKLSESLTEHLEKVHWSTVKLSAVNKQGQILFIFTKYFS